jgi:hypothetical protein
MASLDHAVRPAGATGARAGARDYRPAVAIFMLVVIAHWAEHLVQSAQVFLLGWERAEARGALGAAWPWLVSSEALHYGYAVAMLAGLVLLRPAFVGRARTWWIAALWLQIWHHFEHALLLAQVVLGQPFFGQAAPTSLVQLALPRVELHLFYNAVVFAPMVAAVYLQFRPSGGALRAR